MALYVPNPDRESVEELVEQLAADLVSRYQGAENVLLREIAVRARRELELAAQLPTGPGGLGLTVAERRRQNAILADLAAHRATSLRELQTIAARIVADLRRDDLARQMIHIAATEGEAAAAAQLGLAARPGPTTLTATASRAVGALVLSLDSRLEALNQRITRYPQDAYQRIASIYTPNTLLGVSTSRVQQAQTVQRFLGEGITAFVDEGGRRWTIGAYAEMAGRTSVNRAFNDAGVWRMQQSGINLVTVVRGLDSCKKCAAWAGKILSTDGTPAGTINLPHATLDGVTVPVNIAGTVDDARNAGWNHPNCRCRLVPYMAGLTIPQDDTTYDEAGEKERAKHRSLERDIRAAKRAEATASDDVARARARADVRDAQVKMRDFVKETGRNRQSYREQLHFADGRGRIGSPTALKQTPTPAASADRVASRVIPEVGAAARTPQYVPPGLRVLPHELATGEHLTRVGYNVRWREIDNTPHTKNPDVLLNDDPAPWDFKAPQGNGGSTVSNQFRAAKAQGVQHFVFDMSRTPMDEAVAMAEVQRRFASGAWLNEVIFVSRDGTVTLFTRE